MRPLFFLMLLAGFAACKSGSAKEEDPYTPQKISDSTELKLKADTAKNEILEIGDSIEQMQRRAEAEALKLKD